MINLLPPDEKQKLLLERKQKLIKIFVFIILVTLICFTLILLSIKFYVLAKVDYQSEAIEQIDGKNQSVDTLNSIGIIKNYNATLKQLDSFYTNEVYFSNVLETVISIPRPTGVQLVDFSLNREKSGAIKVIVSGTSDTRDNLIEFKKNIEAEASIINPSFSPESWTSPKKVNFSLTYQNEKK